MGVGGNGRVAGKVAVITGAASGIGEASARRFVEEGARVVIADLQDDRGRAVADSLGDAARYVTGVNLPVDGGYTAH